MKKSISFILAISMLLAAMLGVTSAAEESAEAKLEISSASLQFADTVYPLFAVDYTAVYADSASAAAEVKIEVYRNGELIETLSPSSENLGNPEGTIAFKQENIGLKNMGDIYTYKPVNGKAENAGDGIEYSILEYALESAMLGEDKLSNVVNKMIAVGKAAQLAFGYNDYDYDLSKKYSVTRLAGGATFADGTTKKIFEEGDTHTYVASHSLNADKVVWYNSAFELQGTDSTYTASYGDSVTLFAVPASLSVDLGDGYANKTTQITTGFADAVGAIIGDFANKGDTTAESKFTLTFTLATNSATSAQITLRNTAYMRPGTDATNVSESAKDKNGLDNRQKANVSLFRGANTKGYLGPRYNINGVCVNNGTTVCKNLAPLSSAASGTVGEYITYSIVFDLSGQGDCPNCTKATGCTNCNTDGTSDGKTMLMHFYINGQHKMTSILPIHLSYTLDGETTPRYYFDSNLILVVSSVTNFYIKHFAVTAGDINDYK